MKIERKSKDDFILFLNPDATNALHFNFFKVFYLLEGDVPFAYNKVVVGNYQLYIRPSTIISFNRNPEGGLFRSSLDLLQLVFTEQLFKVHQGEKPILKFSHAFQKPGIVSQS